MFERPDRPNLGPMIPVHSLPFTERPRQLEIEDGGREHAQCTKKVAFQ